MGRLEKARKNKTGVRNKGERIFLIIIALLVVAALFSVFLNNQFAGKMFGQGGTNIIDLENTTAYIDIFGLTYIRVYLIEGAQAESVTANEELLYFNSDEKRWELTTSGYTEGDEIVIVVLEQGDNGRLHKVTLTPYLL